MATSHYCNGKWRDGPVSACPKHKKLSARQPTVHRGVGTPGGFSDSRPSESSGSSDSSGSASSGSSGSSGSSKGD